MRWHRLFYPLALLALGAAYFTTLNGDAFRLPRYYSPGGAILPLGYESTARYFLDIDGKDPATQAATFASSEPVFVTTELGAGIMRPVPDSRWKVIFDFKFFILFSFIYLLIAIWFLQSANDVHLAVFAATLAAFNFSLVTVLAYHRLDLLFQVSGLLLPAAVINMGLRTTGKEVPGYLLVGESIVVLFLALIAYVGQDNAATIDNLARVTATALGLALVFTAGLQLENAIRTTADQVESAKRWVLLGGTCLGFLLPFVLTTLATRGLGIPIPLEYSMAAGLLFPIALIYGTYRLQIVPFQFVLTHSIVATFLTVLLVGIYGIVLLAHGLLLPEQEERFQWIVSVVFVLILVFFLDPARRAISSFVDRRVFRLDAKLTESLKHLAAMLSTHGRIQPAANAFLTEVQNTLNLEKVSFLLSSPSFSEFNLRRQKLLRISEHSPFWKFLTPERLVVTAYLMYAGGKRGELFHYLYKNSFVLAIGILGRNRRGVLSDLLGGPDAPAGEDEVRAALLVGYRRNGTKLELREIRYLQEAAKLAGMLIYNYGLLLQEVRKRRRMRDVLMAGQVQRTITDPTGARYPTIQMAYFNRPAISVTGDYIDMIPISRRQFAFFLGDVSGHGLGTGYIVSSLRAMARAHFESGAGLLDTIQTMNTFLVERYRGHEYITLFALTLDTETGDMDYVNAGHPAPFIYRADGSSVRLASNQHMVGILPTPFASIRVRLTHGDRLYMFSDGVTETFNNSEEAFGIQRLQVFLDRCRTTPTEYIPRQLESTLREFRGEQPITDDASFVTLEFDRGAGPFRGLFQFLGIAQDGES